MTEYTDTSGWPVCVLRTPGFGKRLPQNLSREAGSLVSAPPRKPSLVAEAGTELTVPGTVPLLLSSRETHWAPGTCPGGCPGGVLGRMDLRKRGGRVALGSR